MATEPTSTQDALHAVETLIRYIGDDPTRPGLRDTPKRVLRAWDELGEGYRTCLNIGTMLKRTFTETGDYDEMIIVRDIDFISFCEHHMLPFTGKVHVGYLPQNEVVGLSKIPRLVRACTAKLQIQERLTSQIASALWNHLKCQGCGCIVEATHFCVACRGIRSQNATMVTSSLLGVFRDHPPAREEFLNLVKRT